MGFTHTKFKPEYVETARKLCAEAGFTNEQLAHWFGVNRDTILEWQHRHPEFKEALKVGKAETDDFVERATVAGIAGYYVVVDEMDRFGNVKQMKKWVPGNPHAGMKWLSCRRPEVYRERKEDKHILSMDDAFLKFLDQLDEENKREKALYAPVKQIELKAEVIDVEVIDEKRAEEAAQESDHAEAETEETEA